MTYIRSIRAVRERYRSGCPDAFFKITVLSRKAKMLQKDFKPHED